MAAELTIFALECESLPQSAFVKSTVWIYFNTYASDAVFMAEKPATVKIISAQIYVVQGGLNDESKLKLIRGATQILGRHAGNAARMPVYLVIHEIPETNWGIFGELGNLGALRASDAHAPAL
ncbi:tautomerase family protein [Caballeronia sp. LZ016]|uniref:tautomerase family protein n=1 Tax=Caballeronia sp. LZ016 TaxID=3038554 RepID=UPI00285C01C9|nr:tautomerase family protein [Caballeronia sp. LZ016]MDR5740183.1 tautomerase family protein [Caballeronia sp. LZ016]